MAEEEAEEAEAQMLALTQVTEVIRESSSRL